LVIPRIVIEAEFFLMGWELPAEMKLQKYLVLYDVNDNLKISTFSVTIF